MNHESATAYPVALDNDFGVWWRLTMHIGLRL